MPGISGMLSGMRIAERIRKERGEQRVIKAARIKRKGQGKERLQRAAEILFYFLVFASILCFVMVQTYGDPPDEINRFKVVKYIYNHGTLPHGADPEVLLAGYGASYAFQPMLTYIIQGFLLRFLRLFTEDSYILLFSARMVNVFFGVLMAYFVKKIAEEAWKDAWLQWTFTLLVVFLPQNIFIHSYVNTDSMAMLSVSIIFYALLRAQRTDYDRKNCLLLAAGIILCAMSYYNAYGIILAAMLLFLIRYIHLDGKLWIEWKPMLRKGFYISLIVLLGIGWWFARNAVLYDGDIIAMNARRECAILTATEEYNPLTRFTYQNAGKSIKEMLFDTGYITLLRDSFIAMFGPMIIPTHGLIYIYYKRLWIVACAAALLPAEKIKTAFIRRRGRKYAGINPAKEVGYWEMAEERDKVKVFGKDKVAFYICMAMFCAITIGLSIYYSYTWEFQPQGRYILPILIPFMYLVVTGIGKIYLLAGSIKPVIGKLLCLGIMAYVMAAFSYSVFDRFLPYYMEGENMFSLFGKSLLL